MHNKQTHCARGQNQYSTSRLHIKIYIVQGITYVHNFTNYTGPPVLYLSKVVGLVPIPNIVISTTDIQNEKLGKKTYPGGVGFHDE